MSKAGVFAAFRRTVVPSVALGLLVCSAAVASGKAHALADGRPDLVPQFPDTPRPTQKAPVYMDVFNEPGTTLYRFDAVLFNQGGTLDVYRDPQTGHVLQAIWATGVPTVAPDPNSPPPAGTPGLTTEDITAKGGAFQYITGPDHNHFHFEDIAKYSLVVPGVGNLLSAKVGFCFGDDYGTPPVSYFPYPYTGPGQSWCAVGHPEATFFREGISPNAGDLYNSQVQYQWIDVTGLRAGTYKLRGEVNPAHVLDESNYDNDVVTLPRAIPGVVIRDLSLKSAVAARLSLKASIVAPAIPARQSASCFPRSGSTACLVSDVGNSKVAFKIASTPCYGSVSLRNASSTTATATYRPRAHQPGIDGFSVVATDARQLTSVPGVVRIGHSSASGAPQACLVGGSIGVDRRARLAIMTTGKIPAGAHWALYVNSHLSPGTVTKTLAVSAELPSGKTGFWLELVKGGKPLAHRVQSRQMFLNVPALLKANG